MAGIRPVFERGPITYLATTIANGGNITGGQLVEPDGTTGKIKVAGADSAKCLGVATGDASASDYANADTTATWGRTTVTATYPPNEVAVAYQGVWKLTATGAIAFGDLVACAANGTVKTIGAGVFGTVIGRCVDTAGIAGGAKGRILLGGMA